MGIVKYRGFLIDEEDLALVINYRWYIDKYGYVSGYNIETGADVRLHRLILKAKEDELVDHKDHNPLNNSRSNIRIATFQENSRNQKKRSKILGKNLSSKYKGVVVRDFKNRKYLSYINVNYKQIIINI